MRSAPAWLVDEPYAERELGPLRSGKEAQVDVVERTGADGRTCLLARKRYLPRTVTAKGTLEALGVQRASAFHNDALYRDGRRIRGSRDRRAVAAGSAHGRRLLHEQWLGVEHDVLHRLWNAGAPVPFPVAYADDVLHLEYIGSAEQAAPQLARARLDGPALDDAWLQLVAGLEAIVAAGYAHADLSAYNLLWWDGRLVFIDFPQAVDLATNPQGLDLLHRDVTNVGRWFTQRGRPVDAEAVFAELLGSAFG